MRVYNTHRQTDTELTYEAEHGGTDTADVISKVEETGGQGREGDGEVEP